MARPKLLNLILPSVLLSLLLGLCGVPKTVKFTEYEVTSEKGYGGALTLDLGLDDVEVLFEGQLKGPEAFEVVNEELYTTLHGGFVAKVLDDKIVPVVKFGEDCVGWYEESKCGRPLGIKAFGKDHLLVADAYYGIFKYNVKTKEVENLVKRNQIIDGKIPHIFNSVEVSKDGTIYWTHSSSDFTIQDGVYAFLADGSGRLLKYDPATKKNQVLLKDLFFANGVVLSPNEDYLLISESGRSRVLKYHLKGPKAFTTEVFVDGLPGVPDNLRWNGNGYYIPLVVTKDAMHPLVFQNLTKYPLVRKYVVRLLSLIELLFQTIDDLSPNYYTQRVVHYIGHLESIGMFLSSTGVILNVDLDGKLIESYHAHDGIITSISDVIHHKGYMYLGSPTNNYLIRAKLPEADEIPEHVTTTPPTTTTPSTTTTTTTTTRPPPTTTTTMRPPPPPKTTTRPPPSPVTTSRPSTTRAPTTTASPPTTTTKPPPKTVQTPDSPPKKTEGQAKPKSLS